MDIHKLMESNKRISLVGEINPDRYAVLFGGVLRWVRHGHPSQEVQFESYDKEWEIWPGGNDG